MNKDTIITPKNIAQIHPPFVPEHLHNSRKINFELFKDTAGNYIANNTVPPTSQRPGMTYQTGTCSTGTGTRIIDNTSTNLPPTPQHNDIDTFLPGQVRNPPTYQHPNRGLLNLSLFP